MSMKQRHLSYQQQKHVRSNAIERGSAYWHNTKSELVNFFQIEQNKLVEHNAHLLTFHTMLTGGSVFFFDACWEVKFK